MGFSPISRVFRSFGRGLAVRGRYYLRRRDGPLFHVAHGDVAGPQRRGRREDTALVSSRWTTYSYAARASDGTVRRLGLGAQTCGGEGSGRPAGIRELCRRERTGRQRYLVDGRGRRHRHRPEVGSKTTSLRVTTNSLTARPFLRGGRGRCVRGLAWLGGTSGRLCQLWFAHPRRCISENLTVRWQDVASDVLRIRDLHAMHTMHTTPHRAIARVAAGDAEPTLDGDFWGSGGRCACSCCLAQP